MVFLEAEISAPAVLPTGLCQGHLIPGKNGVPLAVGSQEGTWGGTRNEQCLLGAAPWAIYTRSAGMELLGINGAIFKVLARSNWFKQGRE